MSSINLSQITLEAALNDPAPLAFTPPARPPLGARITCRVCGKDATVPILAPAKLCDTCRADLGETEAHIAQQLAEAESLFRAAVEEWDAILAEAPVEDRARYERACERRLTMQPEKFKALYQQALARKDGLTLLFQAKEACDTIADATQRMRGWAGLARAEVEAARDGR